MNANDAYSDSLRGVLKLRAEGWRTSKLESHWNPVSMKIALRGAGHGTERKELSPLLWTILRAVEIGSRQRQRR